MKTFLSRTFRFFSWCLVVVLVFVGGLFGWAYVRESASPESLAPVTGRFIQADGLKVFIQEKGPPAGRVVFFVSCNALAWSESWRNTIDPLAAAGYRVIAIDLPPFGLTEKAGPEGYNPPAQARRIAAIMDVLQLKKVVLIGHSFGGCATVETAFRYTERVEALILLDGALGLHEPPPPSVVPLSWYMRCRPLNALWGSMTYANALLTRPGFRYYTAVKSAVTPAKLDMYQLPLRMRGTSQAVGDWLAGDLMVYPHDAAFKDSANYARFKPPVLLVWGRLDEVTPLAQGEDLHRRFVGSQMVILEGVNHIPQLEDPAKLNSTLLTFLAGLPR